MIQFKRASRERVKIKIGISGPSGSGKTKGALALARRLAGPTGRIAVLDTENESASLYADDTEFDAVPLGAPYTSARYTDIIHAAVAAGYDVLVIDSLSHQWEGSGGILDRKTMQERKGGANGKEVNGFTLWAAYKEEHRKFVADMLAQPIHIICCMRSRQEYVQGEKNGRKTVTKLGMAPVTGEQFEYELSVVFDLDMGHMATATKDRTELFDDRLVDLLRDDPGAEIIAWLQNAAPATPKLAAATTSVLTLDEARAYAIQRPDGTTLAFGTLDAEKLASMHTWATKRGNLAALDALNVLIADSAARDAEHDTTLTEGTV